MFRLYINTDHPAFDTDPGRHQHVANVLEAIARQVRAGATEGAATMAPPLTTLAGAVGGFAFDCEAPANHAAHVELDRAIDQGAAAIGRRTDELAALGYQVQHPSGLDSGHRFEAWAPATAGDARELIRADASSWRAAWTACEAHLWAHWPDSLAQAGKITPERAEELLRHADGDTDTLRELMSPEERRWLQDRLVAALSGTANNLAILRAIERG